MKHLILILSLLSISKASWVEETPTTKQYALIICAIEGYGKINDYHYEGLYTNKKGEQLQSKGPFQMSEAMLNVTIKREGLTAITVDWSQGSKYSKTNNWVSVYNQDLLMTREYLFNKKELSRMGFKTSFMNLWIIHNLGPNSFRYAHSTDYNPLIKQKDSLEYDPILTHTNFLKYINRNMPCKNHLQGKVCDERYMFKTAEFEGYKKAWGDVVNRWAAVHSEELAKRGGTNVHARKASEKPRKYGSSGTGYADQIATFDSFSAWLKAMQGYNDKNPLADRLFYNVHSGKPLVCKGLCQFSETTIKETLAHFKDTPGVSDIAVNWDRGNNKDNGYKPDNDNNWFTTKNQEFILLLRYRWLTAILQKANVRPSNINLWTSWHFGVEVTKYINTGKSDWGDYTDDTILKMMSNKMPFENMFINSGGYKEEVRIEIADLDTYQEAWSTVINNWHKLQKGTSKMVVLVKTHFKASHHLERLTGVNKELHKIVMLLAARDVKFMLVTGNRTVKGQLEKVMSGYSKALWWGNHLRGNAVDLVPLINGSVVWNYDTRRNKKSYDNLTRQFFKAKEDLGIKTKMINLGQKAGWDYAHYEISGNSGMTKAAFKRIIRNKKLTGLWKRAVRKLNRSRKRRGIPLLSTRV